jgi:hypothetical protein
MARENRHGEPQRGNLCQRKIDEHDTARKDMHAEPRMYESEHDAGRERP